MKGSLSPKTDIGGEVKESRRESGGISHADQSSSGYTEMNSQPPRKHNEQDSSVELREVVTYAGYQMPATEKNGEGYFTRS